MGVGAVFILLIVIIVLAVGALLLFGVSARLRRAKLDPEEDKLDRGPEPCGRRPQHLRVDSGQRSRFLSRR